MEVKRFEIYLVKLEPAVGRELRKTRPCLVISPNEMNRAIATVIVAPLTTRCRGYPTRIPCGFRGRKGEIVLDQLRTIDRSRLSRKLGKLDAKSHRGVLAVLQEMFAE